MISRKLKTLKLSCLLSLINLLSACNGGVTPNERSFTANQVSMKQEVLFDQIGQIPADDKPHSYFIRLFNYSNNDYQLKRLSVTNSNDPQIARGVSLAADCSKLSAHGECQIKLSGTFKQSKSYLIEALLSDANGIEVNANQMLRVVEHPAVDVIELPGYGNVMASASNKRLNLVLPFIVRNHLTQLNSADGANIYCEDNDYRKGSACSYQLSTSFQDSQKIITHISAMTVQGVKISTSSTTKISTALRANLLSSQASEINLSASPDNSTTTISIYNNGTEAAQNIQLRLPADKQLKLLYPAGHCTTTLVSGTSCSYTLSAENIESSMVKTIVISYQSNPGVNAEEINLPIVIIAPARNVELLLEPNRPFTSAALKVDDPLLVKIKNTGTQTMNNLQVIGEPFIISGYQTGSSTASLCRFNDASFNLVPGAFCYIYARVANDTSVELATMGNIIVKADAKGIASSYLTQQDDINIAPDSKLQVSYEAGLEWSWLEYYQNDNYVDNIMVKNIGTRATTPQIEILLPDEIYNLKNGCNIRLAPNSECKIKYSPTINLNAPSKLFSIKNGAAKDPVSIIENDVDTFIFTGAQHYTEQTPRQYTLSPVIKRSLWQIESVAGGRWEREAHALGGAGLTYENQDAPVILPLGREAQDPRVSDSSYMYRGYIQSAGVVATTQYTGNGEYGMPELNLYGALGEADALGDATLSYTDISGNIVVNDFPIRLSHPRPGDGCTRAWRHPLGSAGARGVGCEASRANVHDVNIYIWGPDLNEDQRQHYCAATQNGSNKQVKQLVIVTWPFWRKYWWSNQGGGATLIPWGSTSSTDRLNEKLKDKLENPDFIRTIGARRSYAEDRLQELLEVTVKVDSRTDPVCAASLLRTVK